MLKRENEFYNGKVRALRRGHRGGRSERERILPALRRNILRKKRCGIHIIMILLMIRRTLHMRNSHPRKQEQENSKEEKTRRLPKSSGSWPSLLPLPRLRPLCFFNILFFREIFADLKRSPYSDRLYGRYIFYK